MFWERNKFKKSNASVNRTIKTVKNLGSVSDKGRYGLEYYLTELHRASDESKFYLIRSSMRSYVNDLHSKGLLNNVEYAVLVKDIRNLNYELTRKG